MSVQSPRKMKRCPWRQEQGEVTLGGIGGVNARAQTLPGCASKHATACSNRCSLRQAIHMWWMVDSIGCRAIASMALWTLQILVDLYFCQCFKAADCNKYPETEQ